MAKVTGVVHTYSLGHDYGAAQTDGAFRTEGAKAFTTISMPSIYSPISWEEIDRMAKAAGQDPMKYLRGSHYHLAFVNEKGRKTEEYIGQKVFDDQRFPSDTRSDRTRYFSNDRSLKALFTWAGAVIPDPVFRAYVVTGVPVGLYSEQMVKAIQEALTGTFTYRLNNIDRTISIVEVRVVSESAAALIALAVNDENAEGSIDIGGETTDLYGVNMQQPISTMAASMPRGVSHAMELFRAKCRSKFGIEPDMGTTYLLFRQYVKKAALPTLLDFQRRPIPVNKVQELLTESIETIAQEIVTFIEQRWGHSLDKIKRAFVVGGGAYYFGAYLEKAFPFVKTNQNQPEFANALGYASLAERLMKVRASKKTEMVG